MVTQYAICWTKWYKMYSFDISSPGFGESFYVKWVIYSIKHSCWIMRDHVNNSHHSDSFVERIYEATFLLLLVEFLWNEEKNTTRRRNFVYKLSTFPPGAKDNDLSR